MTIWDHEKGWLPELKDKEFWLGAFSAGLVLLGFVLVIRYFMSNWQ